jgi:hypothetical protein
MFTKIATVLTFVLIFLAGCQPAPHLVTEAGAPQETAEDPAAEPPSSAKAPSSPEVAPSPIVTTNEPAVSTPSDFCEARCNREIWCGKMQNLSSCITECRRDERTFFANARPEYLSDLTACVAEPGCSGMPGGEYLKTCSAEASLPIPPGMADLFCANLERRCPVLPGALCISSVRVYTDEAIAGAGRCLLDFPCDEVPACLAGALGHRLGAGY